MTRRTAIDLPDETYERLEALGARTGQTPDHYIREAVEAHLQDLEDACAAEQVLERVRRGEEETYTLDEVERDLGLAD